MLILEELKKRQEAGNPVRIAVIGTGFFGGSWVRQLARTPGFVVSVVSNRTISKATECLKRAGFDERQIKIAKEPSEAQEALDRGLTVVTDSITLPSYLRSIDVVCDATGDVLAGAEIASTAIRMGKHVVAANPETQCTVGHILKKQADEAGVVYTDIDGDQPGILKNLYDMCKGMGFIPVAAVNCKGVMKRYATPQTQEVFAKENGIRPWIATAAADGTKLNIEMAIVANSTGMLPAKTGMHGIQTTLQNAVADFERQGLLSNGPIVDYTLGIPTGVFVIAFNDEPSVRWEFRYLKMGDGPFYLFYYPYVFCHFTAAFSLGEAALFGRPTIAPAGGVPIAEVATFAKRGLTAGKQLDGIGGFDCVGLIAEAEKAREERWLPIGLAPFARLIRDISQDEPIRYDDVEFSEDNLLLDLRKQQDALTAPVAHP